MSRSIVTRANSAQTTNLHLLCRQLGASRCALQLASPMRLDPVRQRLLNSASVRTASEIRWPESTSRTASCMNSRVKTLRGIFTIFVFPSQFNSTAKGYVLQGQGHASCGAKHKKYFPELFSGESHKEQYFEGWHLDGTIAKCK